MRIKRQLLQSTLAASLLALSFGNAAAALGKTINAVSVVTEDEFSAYQGQVGKQLGELDNAIAQDTSNLAELSSQMSAYQQKTDQSLNDLNDAIVDDHQSISTNGKAIEALSQYPKLIKTYKGCDLRTDYPKACQSDRSLSNQGIGKINGMFSFGPYIKLPEGNYRFVIHYSSTGDLHQTVGWWNVNTAKAINPKENLLHNLKTGLIYSTSGLYNDDDAEIQGQFTIDKAHANLRVEVRTYLDTSETVVLKSLSIYQVSR